MDKSEQKLVLINAIQEYGRNHQTMICVEELSELQKELCKSIRGNNNKLAITEEIADVMVTIEQIKMIHGISESDIAQWVDRKITRLKERINKG